VRGIVIAGVGLAVVTVALADEGEVRREVVPEISGHVGDAESPTIAVVVSDPWGAGGHMLLRIPETLNTVHGLLFIDHHREDMPPLYPSYPLPRWETEADGSIRYSRALANGITYRASATPRPGAVDLTFTVENDSGRDTHVGAQFCLVCTPSELFSDPHYERTWIHTESGWTPAARDRGPMNPRWTLYPLEGGPDMEQQPDPQVWGISGLVGDEGLIAIEASGGERFMALAWENPAMLMNNAMIPCVHADPMWPPVPDGDEATVKGRIYFHVGSLDGLLERYVRDFGHLADQREDAR
jgi:hypothetical protein